MYYFPEETFKSKDSHYFIVINLDPSADVVLLLLCASSQIDKVCKRRSICPAETLVRVSPRQYRDFTVPSVIDCNQVLEKSVDQLVEKMKLGKLRIKTEMDLHLVRQLRSGVLQSPLVERRIKAVLTE